MDAGTENISCRGGSLDPRAYCPGSRFNDRVGAQDDFNVVRDIAGLEHIRRLLHVNICCKMCLPT